jgi:N-acetylmuramoyl-L-alanine amidase
VSHLIPPAWLVPAHPERVIVHWTAGGYRVSEVDRQHYHLILEDAAALGTGQGVRVCRGLRTVADNDSTKDGVYAAHVHGLNTHSIGIAAACMRGALRGKAGECPLTPALWEGLAQVASECCRRYGIAVTERTVLQHGEVERVLGVAQAGKWDCCWLPWEPELAAAEVGAEFRRRVEQYVAQARPG